MMDSRFSPRSASGFDLGDLGKTAIGAHTHREVEEGVPFGEGLVQRNGFAVGGEKLELDRLLRASVTHLGDGGNRHKDGQGKGMVLPAPLGPMNPNTSPSFTVRSRSSTSRPFP